MSEPSIQDLERRLEAMGWELHLGRQALAQAEPLIDRINAELPGLLDDLQAKTEQLAAVRGQRDVLLQLLLDAADVLHTVVGDDADEERELQRLRTQIADACGGVMAGIVAEAQG